MQLMGTSKMRLNISAIDDTPTLWFVYAILLIICASQTFDSIRDLPFDTHDQDYIHDFSRGGFASLLSPDKSMPGRPVFELLLFFEYKIWGGNPSPFHAVGIALHTISCLLLALVCRRLGSEIYISLTAGLFFLFGVSHFQAVHWISAHCYPLAFIFLCLAILCFEHWQRTNRASSLLLTYIFALLGILTHISAALALPICLLIALQKLVQRRSVYALLPLTCIAAFLILAIRFYYERAPQTSILVSELSIVESAKAYFFMLGRLMTTTHWLFIAPYKTYTWEYYVSAVIALGACWCIFRQKSPVNIWCCWIILGLGPFMLISPAYIQEGIPTGPSRYIYMSSAGLAVLLSVGLYQLACFTAKHSVLVASSAYVLSVLSICTSGSYYLRKVEAISLYNSGRYYGSIGENHIAISQLRQAIARAPNLLPLGDTYYRLCNLLLSQGEDYSSTLEEAQRLLPNDNRFSLIANVTQSLSHDLHSRESNQKTLNEIVMEDAARGGSLGSITATVYHNLGLGLTLRGDTDRAEKALQEALRWQPQRRESLKALSQIYFRKGLLNEAAEVVERMIQIDSSDYKMHYVLGKIYSIQQKDSLARGAFRSVLHLAPHSVEADKIRAVDRP